MEVGLWMGDAKLGCRAGDMVRVDFLMEIVLAWEMEWKILQEGSIEKDGRQLLLWARS